jgi:hypothetical protein
MNVGRTPSSAPDPLVRPRYSTPTEADEGVGRGPGGPPHIGLSQETLETDTSDRSPNPRPDGTGLVITPGVSQGIRFWVDIRPESLYSWVEWPPKTTGFLSSKARSIY